MQRRFLQTSFITTKQSVHHFSRLLLPSLSSSSIRNFHFDPETDTDAFYKKQTSLSSSNSNNNPQARYGSALSRRMEAKLKEQKEDQNGKPSSSVPKKKPLQNTIVEEPNLVERTLPEEIRKIHDDAVKNGETNYTDPETGYFVFTRLSHINRGKCCGSACRHCPFGHANVPAERRLFLELQAQKNNQAKKNNAAAKQQQQQQKQQQQEAKSSEKKNNDNNTSPTTSTTVVLEAATKLNKTGQETGVVFTRTGDKGTSGLFSGDRRSKADLIFDVLGTIDELSSNIGVARVETNLFIQEKEREAKLKKNSEMMNSSSSNSSGSDDEADDGNSSKTNTVVVDDDEDFVTSFSPEKKRVLISVKKDLRWIQERLTDAGSLIAMATQQHQEQDNSSSSSSSSTSTTSSELIEQASAEWVKRLERTIEKQTSILPALTNFILPCGNSRSSAHLHVARSVCRRAERCVWKEITNEITDLKKKKARKEEGEESSVGANENSDDSVVNSDHLVRCRAVAKFLNRLSDFLFTSARSFEDKE